MELTFQHGKINKQKTLKDVMRSDRKRSQTGEWSFKGKKKMTINNRRIMIMPG